MKFYLALTYSTARDIKEVEALKATEKTVTIQGHFGPERRARETSHEYYAETLLGALRWLRGRLVHSLERATYAADIERERAFRLQAELAEFDAEHPGAKPETAEGLSA